MTRLEKFITLLFAVILGFILTSLTYVMLMKPMGAVLANTPQFVNGHPLLAGLIAFLFIGITVSVLGYLSYEKVRKKHL